MISLSTVKNNISLSLLLLLMFLPNYGRIFFPRVRESNSIDIVGSLFDPQMLGTYALFIIATFGLFKHFDKMAQASLASISGWIWVIFFVAASLLVSDRFLYSLWRMFEIISLLMAVVFFNILLPTEIGARFIRCLPILFYVYIFYFVVVWLVHPELVLSADMHGDRLGAESEDFMISPATLGPICGMLSGVTGLYFLREKGWVGKLLSLLTLALCLVLAVLSGSRTGYIIIATNFMLISYFSYIWGWTKVHPVFWLSAGIPLVVVLISTDSGFYEFFINFITRGYGEESLSGLSGRVDVWDFAFNVIKEHPFLGLGYANTKPPGSITHMHNAFLELSVGCGLPAAIAASIVILKTGFLGLRLSSVGIAVMDNEQRYDLLLTYIFLAAALLNSMMSAGFAYYSWPLITILLSGVAFDSMRRRVTLVSKREKVARRGGIDASDNCQAPELTPPRYVTTLVRIKK